MDNMRQEPWSVEVVLCGGLATPGALALARGIMGDSLAEDGDQYSRKHREWSLKKDSKRIEWTS